MTVATVHTELRAAARALLQTIPDLPDVAWEGRAYQPTKGRAFVRESVRPIFSQIRAIGIGGTIEHRLTVNLVLVYPAGQGTKAVEEMAGRILAAFHPGLSLHRGSSAGTILQAERAALIQEPDWVSCPVTITVFTHTVN